MREREITLIFSSLLLFSLLTFSHWHLPRNAVKQRYCTNPLYFCVCVCVSACERAGTTLSLRKLYSLWLFEVSVCVSVCVCVCVCVCVYYVLLLPDDCAL